MLLRSLILVCLSVTSFIGSYGQTAIQTSFETAQGYTTGNLHNQNGWTLTTGTAAVSTAKVHTGTQSINLSASGTALLLNHVAYSGTVPGITGEVYADFWVNPSSFTTKGISINGYDLYGGSAKRIFVIEFGTDNNIKAYNGSSAVNVTPYTFNQWVRISIKMDFATEKYKVAVNGNVFATEMAFRETYTPTASGTRQAGIKEFHSLRFNHSNDTQTATTDAAFDDIYVGTAAIPDVVFGASSNIRTITVTQPQYGSIALSPGAPYTVGQTVTATLTLPQGYMNNGWTGDLSGTELVKVFTVNNNMTIGASTGIDISNPPPQHLVSVTQPANGSITLSPASADGMYYQETQVTATVSFEACYQFNGWTGSLSGTQLTKTFTIQGPMTIGADISFNNTPATKRSVTTVTEFKNALAAMNPGDTVEVENGTYNLSSLSITRSGCAARPIVIMAKNKGQAILNGATALVLKNLKYTTLKGFAFQSSSIGTGIKLENCSKVRITENSFAITETSSCTWVYIGDTFGSTDPLKSGYNRVDHNTFDGKTQAGNYIRMDGNINQQSRYDTIDHNHFKNNGPRADNEKESIRVGVSTLSKSSGFTIIEYNLFEDCDGDPEIVSIKSCDNIVRYNTFVRCLGTLCLRQGFRSVVEGNYFFGDNKTAVFNGGTIGCGGVRVYAKDHKIINNYFQGLTGAKWDAAITITNGDVNNNSASLADHYLPENLVVAFNTMVNNKSNIEIGFDNNGNYPLYPINCLITNNIVSENTTPIIKSYSSSALAGVAFANNIMYPTGTSSLGITASSSQVTIADPKLVQPSCIAPADCAGSNAYRVLRLSAASPAVNNSTGSYADVVLDNEKQVRSGIKDIGADEFIPGSPVVVNYTAMDATHVGPNAIDQEYSYLLSGALAVQWLQFSAVLKQGASHLQWKVNEDDKTKEYVIEWSADGIQFSALGMVTAGGISGTARSYEYIHARPVTGKNYYRVRSADRNGASSLSSIVVVDVQNGITVSAYPNPAKESIVVKFFGLPAAGASIRLINSQGLVVKTIHNLSAGSVAIPVTELSAGIYQLEIWRSGQKIFSQRQLITH
jgi:hypothetical protein